MQILICVGYFLMNIRLQFSIHVMRMNSICMAPYICLKNIEARAPSIKLTFKCLKEDVSFE